MPFRRECELVYLVDRSVSRYGIPLCGKDNVSKWAGVEWAFQEEWAEVAEQLKGFVQNSH